MEISESNTRMICANLRAETIVRSSRAEYIEMMQARITELQTQLTDVATDAELGRAYLADLLKVHYPYVEPCDDLPTLSTQIDNAFVVPFRDAATLAALVLEYLSSGQLRPTTPPQIVARMLELARKLAPKTEGIAIIDRKCEVCGLSGGNHDIWKHYSYPIHPGAYRAGIYSGEQDANGHLRFDKDVPD